MRLVFSGSYGAGSWERARRVIYKAEVLENGTNTRFVVTSRSDEPTKLYDWYVRRGGSEGWIKDFKRALKADRLSCHRFFANQFRLLLHAAAYWLPYDIRRRLVRAGVRRMQFDTLLLLLVKIGGRVRQLHTKIRLHLASGHPGKRLWQVLSATTMQDQLSRPTFPVKELRSSGLRLTSRGYVPGKLLPGQAYTKYRSCKTTGRVKHGSLKVASVASSEAVWEKISGQVLPLGADRPGPAYPPSARSYL